MKLKAKVNIDNQELDCTGSIEIHWIKEPQAYITWQFFYGDKLIASKSDNFFFQENKDNMDELIKRVLKKIEGYKIGRKKIFEEIELCLEDGS
jgi:hypothetical protein